MATQSHNVLEALDRIGDAIANAGGAVNVEYPGIANGPVEIVLGFNNDEVIRLVDHTTPALYFSSGGVLTDLRVPSCPEARSRRRSRSTWPSSRRPSCGPTSRCSRSTSPRWTR